MASETQTLHRIAVEQRVGNGSATFVISNEGHTLGNALRNELMKDPSVDLCGYTVPHPMEKIIKVRVQTSGADGSATQKVHEGLSRISSGMDVWKKRFDAALEGVEVTIVPKVDVEALKRAAASKKNRMSDE